MKKIQVKKLRLNEELEFFQDTDILNSSLLDKDEIRDVSLENLKIASTYAIQAFINKKIQELKDQIQSDKLTQDGRFYMPDGQVDGKQTYRMLGSFKEDESGMVLTDISQKRYVKENGKFVEIEENEQN